MLVEFENKIIEVPDINLDKDNIDLIERTAWDSIRIKLKDGVVVILGEFVEYKKKRLKQ